MRGRVDRRRGAGAAVTKWRWTVERSNGRASRRTTTSQLYYYVIQRHGMQHLHESCSDSMFTTHAPVSLQGQPGVAPGARYIRQTASNLRTT